MTGAELLGPLVYMVITFCEPGKHCETDFRGPVPKLECEARKELLLSGADGKPALRYDSRVTIACQEEKPHG